MCSNKANLQIALLRATGVASGYRLVHVTKECFRWVWETLGNATTPLAITPAPAS